MTSRFGGIAVEAPASTGSRFGGVAVEEAAPAKKTPEQLQREAEAARLQVYRDMEAENTFGDNFLIGAGDALVSTGRGLDQLGARGQQALEELGVSTNAGPVKGRAAGMGARDVTHTSGADRLAASQKEEAALREMLAPVRSSGGGIVGNMVMNGLITAPVGGVGGSAMKLATNLPAKTALAAGAEGLVGAGMGALAPTVEGESVTDNMLTQGALGAAMPVAGALLRSAPAQKVADKILDNTPGLITRRLVARNKEGAAKVAQERAGLKALNDADQAAYDIAERDRVNLFNQQNATAFSGRDAAVKQAEQDAAHANYLQSLREQARVDAANKVRADKMKAAADELGAKAGWQGMPADQLLAKKELDRVGSALGALAAPHKLDAKPVFEAAKKLGAGLDAADTSALARFGASAADMAKATGSLSGEAYNSLRRDIVEDMGKARGPYRRALSSLLDTLDGELDKVASPAEVAELQLKRGQYALGHRVANSAWDPKKGLDLNSALRKVSKLSDKGDSQGARRALLNALRDLPPEVKPQKLPQVRPADVPAPQFAPLQPAGAAPTPRELPKFSPEVRDYQKAALYGGAAYALLGPGGAAMLPFAAGATKLANSAKVREATARALRAANMGYGSNLTPVGDEP